MLSTFKKRLLSLDNISIALLLSLTVLLGFGTKVSCYAYNAWDPYFPPEITMPHQRGEITLSEFKTTNKANASGNQAEASTEANILSAVVDENNTSSGAGANNLQQGRKSGSGHRVSWQVATAIHSPALESLNKASSQQESVSNVIDHANNGPISVPDESSTTFTRKHHNPQRQYNHWNTVRAIPTIPPSSSTRIVITDSGDDAVIAPEDEPIIALTIVIPPQSQPILLNVPKEYLYMHPLPLWLPDEAPYEEHLIQ